MRKKTSTTVRFTPAAKEMLERLVEYLGVTRTAVIEMAIREKAKREGIK